MFPIVHIINDDAALTEQLGSKFKFWFSDASSSSKCLFKEGRVGTGENWAEKIASELSRLLQLPHAEYDLAIWRDKRGVVTKSVVPPRGRLVHGNELLARVVTGYDGERPYRQRQYLLRTVMALLNIGSIKMPIGCTQIDGIETAMDVFTGYLMLDAWIANQDRHHENWGLVLTSDRSIYLAPTYDHASGFGRNETDENRERRLSSRDDNRGMKGYVERAVSAFYAPSLSFTAQRLSTVEAFSAAARRHPRAANAWLDKLAVISPEDVHSVFLQIPNVEITETAGRFAQEILYLNQQRLLLLKRNLT
jgi:hypothetical protein